MHGRRIMEDYISGGKVVGCLAFKMTQSLLSTLQLVVSRTLTLLVGVNRIWFG